MFINVQSLASTGVAKGALAPSPSWLSKRFVLGQISQPGNTIRKLFGNREIFRIKCPAESGVLIRLKLYLIHCFKASKMKLELLPLFAEICFNDSFMGYVFEFFQGLSPLEKPKSYAPFKKFLQPCIQSKYEDIKYLFPATYNCFAFLSFSI